MANMRNSPPVVFYRYDSSPAAAKLENILAFKGVPHYRVEVGITLPRPEITDMLGIGYRRIPVLAIGNDVYCDTSLITNAIERAFGQSQGYPTLYPKRKDGGKADTGMIKALTTFYVDRPLFTLATQCLPYDRFTPEFIADRSKWFGAPVDAKKIIERQPVVRSVLSSHMSMLEEQLSDGREFVFDTEEVGYGDLAIYAVYGWVLRFRGAKAALTPEKFPNSHAWISRMADFIKRKREANASSITPVQGEEAAKFIADSNSLQGPEIVYDSEEAECLGVKQGETVAVAPDDNAKDYPTIGKLVGLSREEFVLQVGGTKVPSLRVHFPRFYYTIKPAKGGQSKL